MFFQLTFFTLKRQTWIEDEICFQVNVINGEAFFIFPDVQIEFAHICLNNEYSIIFFTGSYYKHLTVSN